MPESILDLDEPVAPVDGDSGGLRGDSPYLVLNTNFASPLPNDTNFARKRQRIKWGRLSLARRLLCDLPDDMLHKKRKNKRVEYDDEGNVINWKHRTQKCFWVNESFTVQHWRRMSKDAHFRKAVICGSRCACAVCSEKIWNKDRTQFQDAMVRISQRGLYTVMVTFTLRHDRFMRCAESLLKLSEAMRMTKSGKAWQLVEKHFGIEGSITVLENTFSFENGHHPHKHVLEVLNKNLSCGELDEMQGEIERMYIRQLKKLGGSAEYGVAVDVRRGDDYVAGYIAKLGHEPMVKRWGVTNEMSSYMMKTKGNEHGHYSMFQLLDMYGDGDRDAGNAWLDYVSAFTGHGMVRWSPGNKRAGKLSLRELLGMSEDASDQDKAQAVDDKSELFAQYQIASWRKVRTRPHDILEASIDMSFDEFKEYMMSHDIEIESPVFELIDRGFGGTNDAKR